MSRYQVDKLLREMILHPEACTAYLRDRAAFLAGQGDDLDLDDEERQAFLQMDYGILYKRGAHPFLLFGWATRVCGEDMRAFLPQYRAAVAPYGYPDFAT